MKLEKLNSHERDQRVKFDEEPHIYYVDGEAYEGSVTSFVHSFFDEFDSNSMVDKYYNYWQSDENSNYFGMSKEEILEEWETKKQKAAKLGTKLHKDIELFYNDEKVENNSKEFQYFKNFHEDYKNLKPYRTEWIVFDSNLKLSGSIDFCCEENEDLILFDWKRSKGIKEEAEGGRYPISHIPNSNFWHYSLQLNTYKAILEKNYNKKVIDMKLVILHPNNKNYIVLKVPDLQKEIEFMFKERMENLKQEIITK